MALLRRESGMLRRRWYGEGMLRGVALLRRGSGIAKEGSGIAKEGGWHSIMGSRQAQLC